MLRSLARDPLNLIQLALAEGTMGNAITLALGLY